MMARAHFEPAQRGAVAADRVACAPNHTAASSAGIQRRAISERASSSACSRRGSPASHLATRLVRDAQRVLVAQLRVSRRAVLDRAHTARSAARGVLGVAHGASPTCAAASAPSSDITRRS